MRERGGVYIYINIMKLGTDRVFFTIHFKIGIIIILINSKNQFV